MEADSSNQHASAEQQRGELANLVGELVLVLDFGSQYAQLIARRVREQNVYCEIIRHDLPAEQIAAKKPAGIILSGGPSSVYEAGAPHCDPELFKLDIPVLGICYGMQLACHSLGGHVGHCESGNTVALHSKSIEPRGC